MERLAKMVKEEENKINQIKRKVTSRTRPRYSLYSGESQV